MSLAERRLARLPSPARRNEVMFWRMRRQAAADAQSSSGPVGELGTITDQLPNGTPVEQKPHLG